VIHAQGPISLNHAPNRRLSSVFIQIITDRWTRCWRVHARAWSDSDHRWSAQRICLGSTNTNTIVRRRVPEQKCQSDRDSCDSQCFRRPESGPRVREIARGTSLAIEMRDGPDALPFARLRRRALRV